MATVSPTFGGGSCVAIGTTSCTADPGLTFNKLQKAHVSVRAYSWAKTGKPSLKFNLAVPTTYSCVYFTLQANLKNCNLTGFDLSDANLSDANLNGVNLSGANLTGANLTGARIGATLIGTDLTGADLAGADLGGSVSSGIIGTPAVFPTGWTEIDGFLIGPGAGLTNADLSGLDLSGVDLAGALVDGTNLSNANLTGANLTGANLHQDNLSGANLTNADLLGVYPDVRTSTFTGATWSNTTCRDGTNSDNDGGTCINNL